MANPFLLTTLVVEENTSSHASEANCGNECWEPGGGLLGGGPWDGLASSSEPDHAVALSDSTTLSREYPRPDENNVGVGESKETNNTKAGDETLETATATGQDTNVTTVIHPASARCGPKRRRKQDPTPQDPESYSAQEQLVAKVKGIYQDLSTIESEYSNMVQKHSSD
ncbi:uncharacterized protein PV07_08719 [Cladophialophora immunda]|uniref:Uncharacterized protein n=1 Tax=Cladophialophora immunda TaxID=569365 RepID=A0A0D2AKR5_9EURO|nr:uncharacterized protein PV07_08719 [Cladophialophora immunda]KIW25552.1 hypothetical protein PV07_08719 [Cladophialophora immunda]